MSIKVFFYLLTSSLCIYNGVSAGEDADAFVVKLLDKSISVVSPKSPKDKTLIVIENKTLSKIIGQLVTEKYLLQSIAIPSQGRQTITLPLMPHEKIMFIPLAPAYQEVELTYNREAYEIPEKK